MQDKVEPRFNPESIRESVHAPLSDFDDRIGALEASQANPKGSGLLLNVILLVLVVALGALGWLVLDQKQQLEVSQRNIERLERTLHLRSEDELANEASLADQVEQLQSTQADAQQALGRDLTQLRETLATESRERQSLQQTLQQLQQSVSSQDSRITSLQNRPQPADLTANLEALSATVRQLQTEVGQLKNSSNQTNVASQLQSVSADISALRERQQQQAQSLTQFTENLTEQRNQLQALERQLTTRLERIQADVARTAATPTPAPAAANSSDLAMIELSLSELKEDIRAINNARQLINRDLLQLREQINRVQLMLQ